MQPQPLHTAIDHDYCADTSFCKRCGLHRKHVADMQIECRFSDNLVAITHRRARVIQEEDRERKRDELTAYINAVREKLRQEHARE